MVPSGVYHGLIRVGLFVIHLHPSQRSCAKIQRHFWFSLPRTLQELEEKTSKTFVGKRYKNSTVRENYKLVVSEDVH